ncbi:MAG: hypothetical protein WCI02_16780 [Planctomycetota bacterium]|jgi:hypothetical protein
MSLEVLDSNTNDAESCCAWTSRFSLASSWKPFVWGTVAGLVLCGVIGASYYLGRVTAPNSSVALNELGLGDVPTHRIPPELLKASATHGSTTMAVCTAQVDENAEGFFTLDYLTGDLKGWVYYPRMQAFGGLFATNVIQFLGPPGKNPEYLLVSGGAMSPPSGSNVRAAASLLYVVDVKLGQFVAFTIPWSRAMETSGQQQMNPFVAVGGDVIRPMMGPGNRKPPAVNPNGNAGNAGNNAADPNADPNNPANPNAGNQQPPKNNNPNNNNPNNNNKKPPK